MGATTQVLVSSVTFEIRKYRGDLFEGKRNPCKLLMESDNAKKFQRTNEGWMYLAIVMDLYSRKIIGYSINKRMTTPLVMSAMEMAINLRQPGEGALFYGDRGSQYTSKKYRKLLSKHKIEASMSSVGACLDSAPVEHFFGSLKNEWLLNVVPLTRESMAEDVKAYIRYYNHDRLHTANEYLSPVNFENSRKKVSCLT
ncbi:putative transposase OrfB [Piscirickettsia salmonis]|nr:integrase core domain protein [Piscirickettsia salmonis LF-89 = ATCC VR-1361]QGN78382.1 putative transposase OrfB [Piscirickettsia salmonis]WGZ72912.1 IS3 family transposase [Piscirickettsia salmonis EM-90]QGN81965.1 putative transposase OrfB [Piscirickettsia salmonis]QGN83763.1 putative transposase OrfB [Piscirickettsia salmonis]